MQWPRLNKPARLSVHLKAASRAKARGRATRTNRMRRSARRVQRDDVTQPGRLLHSSLRSPARLQTMRGLCKVLGLMNRTRLLLQRRMGAMRTSATGGRLGRTPRRLHARFRRLRVHYTRRLRPCMPLPNPGTPAPSLETYPRGPSMRTAREGRARCQLLAAEPSEQHPVARAQLKAGVLRCPIQGDGHRSMPAHKRKLRIVRKEA